MPMKLRDSWWKKMTKLRESIGSDAIARLKKEALKYASFDEFKRAFMIEIKRGTYWHFTDNPEFFIDVKRGPRDMSSLAGGGSGVAGKLMVTSDFDNWRHYYGTERPFAVLIDLSAVQPNQYHQISRGFGNEFIVHDASKAKVLRVYPVKQAKRVDSTVDRAIQSVISGYDELRSFYNKAHGIEESLAEQAEGFCFPYTYQWALDHLDVEQPVIVHGQVSNPEAPDRFFWHAWIEWEGRVLDWQTEQAGVKPMRYFKWYALHKPKNTKRYTPEDVVRNCVGKKHHGPWHESLEEEVKMSELENSGAFLSLARSLADAGLADSVMHAERILGRFLDYVISDGVDVDDFIERYEEVIFSVFRKMRKKVSGSIGDADIDNLAPKMQRHFETTNLKETELGRTVEERISDVTFLEFADRVYSDVKKAFERIQKQGTFHRYFNQMPNSPRWYVTELNRFTSLPSRLYLVFVTMSKGVWDVSALKVTAKAAYGHIRGEPTIFLSGHTVSALEEVLPAVWEEAKKSFVHELTHYYDDVVTQVPGKGKLQKDMPTERAWQAYFRRASERNAYIREILSYYFDRVRLLKEKGRSSDSSSFQTLVGRDAKDFYRTVREGWFKDTLDDMEKHLKPRQWRAVQKRIVGIYAELVRYIDGEKPLKQLTFWESKESLYLEEQRGINFDRTNLQKEYDKINKKAFDGKLPKIALRWSNSKRLGGWVHAKHNRSTGEIRIKELVISRFFKLTREEFIGILAHEMIHVEKFAKGIVHEVGGDHGVLFKKRCDQVSNMLGVPVPYSESSHSLGIANPEALKPVEVLVLDYQKDKSQAYLITPNGKITRKLNELRYYFTLSPWGKRDVRVRVYRSTNPDFHRYTHARSLFDKYGILKRYRMSDKVWNLLTGAELVHDEYINVKESIEETKLMEAKEIMFHGTSTYFLRSILKKGLIPDPKKKMWGVGTGKRESYPGVYFTSNFGTAVSSATSTRQKYGGENLIVAAQIETRASEVVLDEDLMPDAEHVWGSYMRDAFGLVGPGEHSQVAVDLWHGDYSLDWDKLIAEFLRGISIRGQREYIPLERWVHAGDEIKEYLEAYLAYRVSQFVTGEYLSWEERRKLEKELNRPDDEIVWVTHSTMYALQNKGKPQPDFEKSRRHFREATAKLLNKLKDLSVKPEGTWMHNVRVTTPVTYRGANRILGIFEVVNTYDDKDVPYYKVVQVHYLKDQKAANEYIKEHIKFHGPNFKMVYLKGTRGPKYDVPETKENTVRKVAPIEEIGDNNCEKVLSEISEMSSTSGGLWLDIDTGETVEVFDHETTVRSNPRKFGLSQSQLSRMKERDDVLKAAMKNGWIRMRRHRNYIAFEHLHKDRPDIFFAILQMMKKHKGMIWPSDTIWISHVKQGVDFEGKAEEFIDKYTARFGGVPYDPQTAPPEEWGRETEIATMLRKRLLRKAGVPYEDATFLQKTDVLFEVMKSLRVLEDPFLSERTDGESVEFGRLSEAGLARLWSKTKEPFSILTAFRNEYTKKQNIQRNKELIRWLNANKMGAYRLIGHWREAPEGMSYEQAEREGKLTDVTEDSLMVPKPEDMPLNVFREVMVDIMQKYGQDAVVFGDGQKVMLLYRDGTTDVIGKKPAFNKIAQAYSQLRKKPEVPFVFEGVAVPVNSLSCWAFKTLGLLYPRDLLA